MLRLVCLTALVTGCTAGNSDTSPNAPKEAKAAPAANKHDTLSDEACRCMDQTCAERVQAKGEKLLIAARAELEQAEAEYEKKLKGMQRGRACLTKLLPGAEQAVIKLADATCDCQDKACTQRQEKEFQALVGEVQGKRGNAELAEKAVLRGMQCIVKIDESTQPDKAPVRPASP